jgi:polar amino acid transport system substrate-binding protein
VKLAILLLALLGLAPGAHAVTPQYQVVTKEWAPYNYIQDGEVTGITTEIVRALPCSKLPGGMP